MIELNSESEDEHQFNPDFQSSKLNISSMCLSTPVLNPIDSVSNISAIPPEIELNFPCSQHQDKQNEAYC